MKAKPIFIIKLPTFTFDADTQVFTDSVKEGLKEYNVMVIESESFEEIGFECFYEKDFNEVKFEELKQMVKDMVSQ
tara:strand:- start:324 stop:551 length:228 start_codon:yes stop_codon:yes gene_type:complete